MRIALIAAAASLALLGCRDPDTSQANDTNANIGEERSPADTASAKVVTHAGQPVGKEAAARIMHERDGGMEAIGKANKVIKRELGGSPPNLAEVRSHAGKVAELAQKASGWFPAGTGPDAGKTGAKPEIWQKPEDFAAKLKDFQTAATAFNAVSAGNDVNAIRTAFGDLGKTCKACHDSYRSKEKP